MDLPVPYMPSVTNLPKIIAAIQKAACPETFTVDFLRDLGFKSSNDRSVTKVLRYLGLLDGGSKPTTFYKEVMDTNKSEKVLARRLIAAFDDLFASNRTAHEQSAAALKGWFKTKTGEGDAVSKKIATTFKALADLADFTGMDTSAPEAAEVAEAKPAGKEHPEAHKAARRGDGTLPQSTGIGLVYRLEIHLPDTQNVDTFRAIFKALREELA